jgi:hypothetical protein
MTTTKPSRQFPSPQARSAAAQKPPAPLADATAKPSKPARKRRPPFVL